MKNVISFAFLVLFFALSCQKENNDEFVTGEWSESVDNFLVEVSDTVSFIDLFSKPWDGQIIIDGKEVFSNDIRFIVDNVFGSKHIISDSIHIMLYSDSIFFYYQNREYKMENNNGVNLAAGSISVNGYASVDNKKVPVILSLSTAKTVMEKGKIYVVKDGLSFLKNPIHNLSFFSDGSLSGSTIDIDVLFNFEGDWSRTSDILSISYSNGDKTFHHKFEYSFNGNDILILTKDISYDSADVYSAIPKSKIKRLRYQSIFKRQL